MKNDIPHTVYLQDGSLCNFKKRIWKKSKSLLSCFSSISDSRKKRGIRHELSFILFILFAGITSGSTTLKDCHLWALHNQKFLNRYFFFPHGIPDPTTISYLLRKLEPEEVVNAYTRFLRILGATPGDIVSCDGKTMRAVTGTEAIRHMLSLFSHGTHMVLSQIGVTQKENEIPAFRRLLEKLKGRVPGFLFVADALHAQTETADAIVNAGADYFLVIKGNQKDFFEDIYFSLTPQEDIPGTNWRSRTPIAGCVTYGKKTRKRDIVTTVITTNDPSLCSYLTKEHSFPNIKTVGKLHRIGKRVSKDGTITPIDEIVCFVSSRKLTASEAASLLQRHWCIENNLHWVKDFVFLEDRQTLRSGNAPQIMSFFRSMCISIFNLVQFQSISDALHNFQKSKTIHYQFLKMAAIV